MRISDHPILGKLKKRPLVEIEVDGEKIQAFEGETIASALIANGRSLFRYTKKNHEPRGVFCAIGRCTDCLMIVDGIPNVRTCITTVKKGMRIETQKGLGEWKGL